MSSHMFHLPSQDKVWIETCLVDTWASAQTLSPAAQPWNGAGDLHSRGAES